MEPDQLVVVVLSVIPRKLADGILQLRYQTIILDTTRPDLSIDSIRPRV